MTMPVRALLLSLPALWAVWGPAATSAQELRGVATAAVDGVPVAGAFLELVDASGRSVHTTLSGPDGTFAVVASGQPPHTLRGEAVGYGRGSAPVPPSASGAPVVVPFPPLTLDTEIPRIRADASCRIPEEDRGRIATLWAEAGKVFRLVEWGRTSGLVQVQTETWYKSMEPRRLRVTEEGRSPRPGFHVDGRMPSPSAPELAEHGFIQGGGPGESLAFHGPDPATLLHPVFFSTHCLGFEPSGPEDGWVGLTFAPLDEDSREVEGTLWVEAVSGAPRRLEFRYTTLPWPIKTEKVGGGMELDPLDNGAWIVRRWWLRMPRVGVREERITQWDAPRRRFTLTGVVEEGGVVTRVRLSDGRIESLNPPQP